VEAGHMGGVGVSDARYLDGEGGESAVFEGGGGNGYAEGGNGWGGGEDGGGCVRRQN